MPRNKALQPTSAGVGQPHTATRALRAGKSLRWISDQLGHADPAFTLRTYAHLMPDEEPDLSFADFTEPIQPHRAVIGVPKRPYTAPLDENEFGESRNYAERLARREGFASQRSGR